VASADGSRLHRWAATAFAEVGQDPLGAAINWAEALGPTRFDGWDAHGEPVGAPYPTPLISCLGTSESQVDNTWRPLLSMARNGPLVTLPRSARSVRRTLTWPAVAGYSR
jgi:hypothetical protein